MQFICSLGLRWTLNGMRVAFRLIYNCNIINIHRRCAITAPLPALADWGCASTASLEDTLFHIVKFLLVYP